MTVTESSGQNEVIIAVLGDGGIFSGNATISIITDTDGNGNVDLKDVSIFMAAWFSGNKIFDFNGDGRMTFIDFSILLSDVFYK